jgi:hypothetical protein
LVKQQLAFDLAPTFIGEGEDERIAGRRHSHTDIR